MTSAPPTTISIINSVKEPRVPDKPNPVREQLPPVPPLAPITPWADRQRPSSVSGTNGAGGSGDKSNEKSRHSSTGEGRSKKHLKKKDRKRSRSRGGLLLDSDDEDENAVANVSEKAASTSKQNDDDQELNLPPKKKRKAIPRKQCKECPARVPLNEMKKHAVTHCYKWWDKDGIEKDPNTGTWNCNQSGCDSFYESREDTIAHLALYHKQFELKMDERGKNINEFYEIYSAPEISPACIKKGEMKDLTRVASNSARSKKGAEERRVENSMEEERNALENAETVSSSSGSTATEVAPKSSNGTEKRAENSDATSRFLDEVLSSDSSE